MKLKNVGVSYVTQRVFFIGLAACGNEKMHHIAD